MESNSTISVAEHFYSIQGEGPTSGIPSVFLRLAGCNLLCGGHGTIKDKQLHNGATWRCDTIEVWSKGQKYFHHQLIELFQRKGYIDRIKEGSHLIVTGGEPMLQQTGILKFLIELKKEIKKNFYVEIETNGTIIPNVELVLKVDQWNVSVKLANSGMSKEKRINQKALDCFREWSNVFLKLVISRAEDLKEVERISEGFKNIILMPAGSTREELNNTLPLVADYCKEYGYRLSTRMQVEIWNKATGV